MLRIVLSFLRLSILYGLYSQLRTLLSVSIPEDISSFFFFSFFVRFLSRWLNSRRTSDRNSRNVFFVELYLDYAMRPTGMEMRHS